ncbi:MAG: hypothetical protein MZV64_49655 [Ignavibacteriales bacterium]|nr:hypothetical protein [Ignavibacteriales bacterium]
MDEPRRRRSWRPHSSIFTAGAQPPGLTIKRLKNKMLRPCSAACAKNCPGPGTPSAGSRTCSRAAGGGTRSWTSSRRLSSSPTSACPPAERLLRALRTRTRKDADASDLDRVLKDELVGPALAARGRAGSRRSRLRR